MPEETVRVGVGVLVVDERGRILLGKRRSKLGESTYSLPGGHLEFGETPEECAWRELKEETDLDASDGQVISLTNDVAYGKHYVTIGVLVRGFSGEIKVMEEDKCEGWNWYDPDSLPYPLFVPSAKFITNYLEKKFYK